MAVLAVRYVRWYKFNVAQIGAIEAERQQAAGRLNIISRILVTNLTVLKHVLN